MEENTPKKIKMGMVAVIIAAIVIIVLNAYGRGWL